MTLGTELIAKGWKVTILSGGTVGDHGYTPEWFTTAGITHIQLPYQSRNPINFLMAAVRTLRIGKTLKPTLVHVHWRVTSIFAQLLWLRYRIPFVSTLHLLGIGESKLHRLVSFWGKRTIAISSECQQYLVSDFGLDPEHIDLIFNGADSHHFKQQSVEQRDRVRLKFNVTDSQTTVVSLIGRLEPVKGHALLLKAVSPLVQAGKQIEILFAGQGSQQIVLANLANELGLSKCIQFLGHTDPLPVLWASDINVLPSFKEGFPLSTVEAMMCGVPTIRSATSGAHDVIEDGKTGYIIPINDVQALEEKLRLLIENPGLRQTIAQNAHQKAHSTFTAERMAEQTLTTYLRVIGE